MRFAVLLSVFGLSLFAQKQTESNQARASGTCSLANSGTIQTVTLICNGLSKDQVEILKNVPALLNEILARQLTRKEAEGLFKDLASKVQDVQAGIIGLRDNPPDPSRGVLVPANEPNPAVTPSECGADIPEGWFRLYLGAFTYATPGFPSVGISIRDKPVLSFKQQDGGIGIEAKVISPEGKSIAVMRDNFYRLDDYFRKEVDKSTLKVFDENNDEPVLSVHFLNPKAILVTGTFSIDGETVVINKDEILMPNGSKLIGGCSKSPNPGGAGFLVQ